jgi:hypothetical protein
VNPTVVMTDMGKMAWSDPAKAGPMLNRIPLGRFAEVCSVLCERFSRSGQYEESGKLTTQLPDMWQIKSHRRL